MLSHVTLNTATHAHIIQYYINWSHCITLCTENDVIDWFERLELKQYLKSFIQRVRPLSLWYLNTDCDTLIWYWLWYLDLILIVIPWFDTDCDTLIWYWFSLLVQRFNQLSDLALLTDTDLQDTVCVYPHLSLSLSLSLSYKPFPRQSSMSLNGKCKSVRRMPVECYP